MTKFTFKWPRKNPKRYAVGTRIQTKYGEFEVVEHSAREWVGDWTGFETLEYVTHKYWEVVK